MEGRDVAMVLASAVAGVVVYKCMEYLSCRAGSEGTNTMTSREEKESRDSEEQKEDQKSEDEESEEEDEDELTPTGNIKDNYTLASGKFKMVLCVNMSLQMGKGKIAAQCGHATLGAYRIASQYCKSALKSWLYFGQAKIALKVENDEKLLLLEKKASELGLVTCLIHDAGHTQIAAGSRTCLAIGPAPYEVIDSITGDLKLLGIGCSCGDSIQNF